MKELMTEIVSVLVVAIAVLFIKYRMLVARDKEIKERYKSKS